MIYCTHPDHQKPGRIPWVLGEKCLEHEPKPKKPRYRWDGQQWRVADNGTA